jgi:hypothetical protein
MAVKIFPPIGLYLLQSFYVEFIDVTILSLTELQFSQSFHPQKKSCYNVPPSDLYILHNFYDRTKLVTIFSPEDYTIVVTMHIQNAPLQYVP